MKSTASLFQFHLNNSSWLGENPLPEEMMTEAYMRNGWIIDAVYKKTELCHHRSYKCHNSGPFF